MIQATEYSGTLCCHVREQIISFVTNGSGFWPAKTKGFIGYPCRLIITCRVLEDSRTAINTNQTRIALLIKISSSVHAGIVEWLPSFLFDVELRVPLSRLVESINHIKKLTDLNPQSVCEIYVVFRYIKKLDAYLGPAEDVITLELLYYRPREANAPKWKCLICQAPAVEPERLLLLLLSISSFTLWCRPWSVDVDEEWARSWKAPYDLNGRSATRIPSSSWIHIKFPGARPCLNSHLLGSPSTSRLIASTLSCTCPV